MEGAARGLRGTKPGELPRPSRRFATGRVCEVECCRTVISVYNAGGRCWLHAPPKFPIRRGRVLAPTDEDPST